ncbi:MAG: hypothetical protein SNJ58_14325 [Aggregatilineales bacterium]
MTTQPNKPTQALPPDPPEVDAPDLAEFEPPPQLYEAPVPAPAAPLAPSYELPPAPNPHIAHFYQPERFACLRCGSTNLARGYIVEFGGQRFEQVRFAPRRIPLKWLNSLLNLRPWRRLLRLEAVACRDCGAVLLTVDPEALRRAERIRDA